MLQTAGNLSHIVTEEKGGVAHCLKLNKSAILKKKHTKKQQLVSVYLGSAKKKFSCLSFTFKGRADTDVFINLLRYDV